MVEVRLLRSAFYLVAFATAGSVLAIKPNCNNSREGSRLTATIRRNRRYSIPTTRRYLTAKRFVKEGAYVLITGRRRSELDKAAAEIGSSVTAVKGDISNLGDLDQLYQEVAATKGKLDILFANAGVAEYVPTTAVTPEHYDRTFDINARGVFFTVQKGTSPDERRRNCRSGNLTYSG